MVSRADNGGVINLRVDATREMVDFECDTCKPVWGVRFERSPEGLDLGFRVLRDHLDAVHGGGALRVEVSCRCIYCTATRVGQLWS